MITATQSSLSGLRFGAKLRLNKYTGRRKYEKGIRKCNTDDNMEAIARTKIDYFTVLLKA
jgi:hypothetical protein